MWETVVAVLTKYESIAVWLEGIALVAIFFLDWREYRKQGADRIEQHKESVAQMEIMQSHAIATKDGSEAAKANADAARLNAEATKESIEMLINKERARLTVEVDDLRVDFGIVPPGKPILTDVKYRVCFYGYTPAFIVDAKASAFVNDSKEPCDDPYLMEIRIPKVISPATETMNQNALLFPSLFPAQSELDEIHDSKVFVHFRGFIRYKDVFDRVRETRFRMRWDESRIPGLSGRWTKCGPEKDNLET